MKYSFEIKSSSYSEKLKEFFGLKGILFLPITIIIFCIFYFNFKNETVRYGALIMSVIMLLAAIVNEFRSYIYKVEFDEKKIIFHKNYLNFKKAYEWKTSDTKFRIKIPYNSGRLRSRFEIIFENFSTTVSPAEFVMYDKEWSVEDLYKIYTALLKLKDEKINKKQAHYLELLEAEVNFVPPF